MIHLSENLLNEYLDDCLDPSAKEAADQHLATCADCRTRLDDLRLVFSDLTDLHEQEISRDLTPAILVKIGKRRLSILSEIALAIQAGIAIGLLILFTRLGWELLHCDGKLTWFTLCKLNLTAAKPHTPVIHLEGIKFTGIPLPGLALCGLGIVFVLLLIWGNRKLLGGGLIHKRNGN